MSLSGYNPRGKATLPPPDISRSSILGTPSHTCAQAPGPVPSMGNHMEPSSLAPTISVHTWTVAFSFSPCKPHLWPPREGLLISPVLRAPAELTLDTQCLHRLEADLDVGATGSGWCLVCCPRWWSRQRPASAVVSPLSAENLVFRKHLLP